MTDIDERLEKLQQYFKKAMEISGPPILKLIWVEGKKRLFTGLLTLAKPEETVESSSLDYDSVTLQTIRMTKKEVKPFLNNLVKSKRVIHNDINYEVKGLPNEIRHKNSNSSWGYITSEWPSKYCEIGIGNNKGLPNDPLIGKGLPLYPDPRKAVSIFLDLNHQSPPDNLYISIPNYSARLTKMTISNTKIVLNLDSYVDAPKLLCRMYADELIQGQYETKIINTMQSPELEYNGEPIEYEFPGKFDSAYCALLDASDYSLLDQKVFRYSWKNQDGIEVDNPDYDIREIIRRGETDTTEFKEDLSGEFHETIVAFANGSGGLLLLGIADDGRVKGFKPKSEDQIQNTINGNLDPIPKVSVSEIELDGKPITLVSVSEGKDKPYSHRELGVYVRSGGSDLRGTRSDWERFFKERGTHDPYTPTFQ